MRVYLLLFIVAVSQFSCSLLPEAPSRTFFQLQESSCEPTTLTSSNSGKNLGIISTTNSSLILSQKILFAPSNIERASYQYASWVESPARRLLMLLRNSLECRKKFKNVSLGTSSIDNDFSLNFELLEFAHFIDPAPGVVKVSFRLELVDLINKKIVRTQRFDLQDVPETYDVRGAVLAFNNLSQKLLQLTAEWIENSL